MKYGAIYPSLKGRTVLVTGGGSGIGESIVTHFAAQGAKVGFLDIKEKESRALAARLSRKKQKVHFEPVDLTDIDALKQAVRNVRKVFGPITILINNAAHDERHKLDEVTSEYFDDRIRVNLKHQLFTIQEVVPDMKKAKGGAIVAPPEVEKPMVTDLMAALKASLAGGEHVTNGHAKNGHAKNGHRTHKRTTRARPAAHRTHRRASHRSAKHH
jgi:NAD(P)-dependent dehydrogenase (short-subunit alcohol dehydrogenase family)